MREVCGMRIVEICGNNVCLSQLIMYIHVNQKMISMYSLDCSFFDREFHTINELINHIINFGCDPNYEITKNGVGIGEQAWDYIQC